MKEPISGILVLNKPSGPSSRQALDQVAVLLPGVKMGHAGTLDPMASGVLVVCVGRATRLTPFVQRMPKEYEASLRLGQRSDTHDLESEVLDVPCASPIVRESLESILARFHGDILQVPPRHSAVHIAGRRAYEWARAGRAVDLQPRPVHVERINCTRFGYPEADLNILCSSGTYIRSLVRDIGDALGCGAVMTRLVRTRVGVFRLDEALDPTALSPATVRSALRPMRNAVHDLPALLVPPERLEHMRHGR